MAPRPVRLTNPTITLTNTATTPVTVDFTCFCSGVHLVPEEDDAAATFCDPMGFLWTLTLDLKMSLGVGSLEEAYNDLGGAGTVVEFDFAYDDDVASETNPHWTGEVRLVALPIVDAGINEVTEITYELDVIGEPTREPAVTPPAVLNTSTTRPATTTTAA